METRRRLAWPKLLLPMLWESSVSSQEKLKQNTQSQQAGFIYLILCTVSGVAAGLQNTG